MLGLDLALTPERPLRLLCLGAHADDIEIGCGATVARLLERHPAAEVCWVVFSGDARRHEEARASAAELLGAAARREVILLDHRDGYLPFEGAEVKHSIERVRRDFTPDLVLTHTRRDRHQDHRLIAELSWNIFRDQLVLEYEIPKWEGDLGLPSLYVPVTRAQAERKVAVLMRHFGTQRGHDWFTPDTFFALMRLRGLECRAPDGYAEAFHAPKTVLLG
jgi:LmbE family N-acetylglucosaminyl deacetylase